MIYVFDFQGEYPVGACAVVTARNEREAKEALGVLLRKRWPRDGDKRAEKADVMWHSHQPDTILLDGDY